MQLHAGHSSEYDAADEQAGSRSNVSFGPSQPNSSLRQPLLARPDHENAVHILQEVPLHHQHNGDKHQSRLSHSSASPHKPV